MCLSIITINYNNCDGLKKTIDSVVSQTLKVFEWIVVDGGSTDGSKELIERYSSHFAYWVSEPDKGIYNAMNKGIKVAKGEYLLFLNSGDWLCNESIIQDFVDRSFMSDIVDGDINFVFENITKRANAPDSVDFDFFYHNTLWHPTAFIRKSLFDQYGLYDEHFRIISDWEFFLRTIVINGASYEHFNQVVSYFPVNGISANPAFEQEIHEDKRKVFLSYVPESFLDAYKKLDDKYKKQGEEVLLLRNTKNEYENLKNGKLGFIIDLLLKFKSIKKRW